MFVLLMLFLFKYIDDMIGKGFDWYVILELMLYSSATNVAMALPLSVLLSSIMTYGSLGENYELVAIKSAGISLGRALYPMIIAVCGLSISAFFFSEYMLPVANLKYYSLLYDVRQQKTAFLINENVFNNSFPGYSIRVKKKDADGRTLRDIMIYSRSEKNPSNLDVTFAAEGIMYRTENDLVIRLKNGIRYAETPADNGYMGLRSQFTRSAFTERVARFDLSVFKPKRTAESEFKGAFQMMNRDQLNHWRDSVNTLTKVAIGRNFGLVTPYFRYFLMPSKPVQKGLKYIKVKGNYWDSIDRDRKMSIIANALNEARAVKEQVKARADRLDELQLESRRNRVEYQKKYTLSAACLALFLIGAPLGAIIRKGGLGLPVVVSVIFFLIYYIISTIGEKFVKDGDLSPMIGMWIAIVVLTPIGLFLSYKAANDSELFNVEAYNKLIKKITRIFNKKAAQ
ncbi:hypothetical protein GCM10028827_40460 [Mucilaginibacter myungsuensis]